MLNAFSSVVRKFKLIFKEDWINEQKCGGAGTNNQMEMEQKV
jgi:hypothetical protein